MRALLVLIALAAPASAQVWEVFARDCPRVLGFAGPALDGPSPSDPQAAETEDGWHRVGTASYDGLGGVGAAMNWSIDRIEGGRLATCGLTVFGDGDLDAAPVLEAARAGAEAVLGTTPIFSGGALSVEGQDAELLLAATPGFPPDRVVRVMGTGRVILVGLSVRVAEAE